MLGQNGGGDGLALRAAAFEQLADAAVQAPAARGREVAVGQLAEQVMHELDAARVARLAEHAARQQGVDRVEHVGSR